MRTLLKRVLMAAAPAAAAFAPAAAQEVPRVQSQALALAEDAAEYARDNDLPLEEALWRLEAQEATVPATDAIAAQYRDRLAGIFIEHRPDYRIVVMLTGTGKVKKQAVEVGGRTVPILFRTGAGATRDSIVAAIEKHQAAIRASVYHPPGMGADPRNGELVVLVHRDDAAQQGTEALDERFEALTGVPVRIRVLDGRQSDLDVGGGARVEGIATDIGRRQYCTTGFVVTDGARTGVLTAAHCPDTLTYFDPEGERIELGFVGQWGWSFRDVQVHASERAQKPLFYADTAKTSLRSLSGARTRSSTRAGDIVCHRGETTGYSCSPVEFTDYAPPGDLCGGPCAPSWVTVKGRCRGGDSGGPVFLGTRAFGILKGGGSYGRTGCDFYYYMSTDFLPDGWSLLREEASPPAPAPASAASG